VISVQARKKPDTFASGFIQSLDLQRHFGGVDGAPSKPRKTVAAEQPTHLTV
jgi:hypothetical protein